MVNRNSLLMPMAAIGPINDKADLGVYSAIYHIAYYHIA